MIERRRVYSTGFYLASLKELLKTIKYEPSEYSYIWLIRDSPVIAKKRMAPRMATGV